MFSTLGLHLKLGINRISVYSGYTVHGKNKIYWRKPCLKHMFYIEKAGFQSAVRQYWIHGQGYTSMHGCII